MNVIILRGISGSGKSTWINTHAPHATVVSADHFFLRDGVYQFDPTKLQEAHMQCFREFMIATGRRDPLIVVDNTNIAVWEFAPYVLAGRTRDYEVEILTLACDPEVAIARKNLVAPEKVRATAKRLEEETKRMPPFMQSIHRVMRTDIG